MPDILSWRSGMGGAVLVCGALLACSPTDSCGCTYPPPQAIVYGEVTDPNGAVVPDAEVVVELADPGCTRSEQVIGTARSNLQGRYRVHAAVGLYPKVGDCLRAFARPPTNAAWTQSDPIPFSIHFRITPIDSVRIDLQLRGP